MSTTLNTLRVGDRTAGSGRMAADLLAESGIVLPTGTFALGTVAAELLTPPVPAAHRTGLRWTAITPVTAVDRIRSEAVVTRVEGTTAERFVRVLDAAGAVREEGTETWRLATPSEPVPALDFCTPAWGELLRDHLEADPAFGSALATWDGTVGLRCGDRELHLRIYRGRIVDVTRRTPHGATFTFVAPDHTWVDLILGAHDDFMRRAIGGEFSSTGDGYEYLRLTKPLNLIIGHARAVARKACS
ncbi:MULTISPECIES: hypothetical protein [unclassified Rhodococcus (in: high G+C Gram-positive bacteria)]|uniref:hypothetical protein n=1 Tax=unclassified Rhodococcus (in: high G+C Gram-positive bacteria) TaxID=192944 RepID=UPI0009262D62|nr:hypothetical protein [Rhodococcus sp. M8]OLL19548.1 hypothetical protein BKE56_005845 [Rhodococcus sp. M8]QPG43380.1 hypothetical protein ISO16_15440 [Rhodococcus sp. M8]